MSERALQSALEPASGSGAVLLDQLGTILYIGAGVIFTAVMALALMGVFMRERNVNARRWVIGGGLIFPAVTLTALLIYSVSVGNALASIEVSRLFLTSFGSAKTQTDTDIVRVHVVGKQWWWEVRYEVPGSSDAILANELHVPVDRAVLISLATTDVIHSFWVPSLAGKVDMIPGRTTQLRIQTSEPGVYRGQCAEYCGGQHAWMAFYIVAESQAEFDAWLERQRQPAVIPADPELKLGYDAFFEGKCHDCHRIRGTSADGDEGPDLTHVGGRRSLGAGLLDNHIGTMAGWIAGAQDVKPGNPMPSEPVYTGRELRAVSAWLSSLK